MPTRQQRRAKARAPIKKKRKGAVAFLATMIAIILAGGAAVALLRLNPPPITRGAISGEHWHADYKIEICGKPLQPFPSVEGEIHTHGDGKIHDHPHSPQFSANNANLGAFFRTVETTLGRENGKNFIIFPDGKRYQDGGTCEGSKKKEKLEVLANGKTVEGDPGLYVIHEGDKIVIRFGPEAKGAEQPNPLTPEPGKPAVTREGPASGERPRPTTITITPLPGSPPPG